MRGRAFANEYKFSRGKQLLIQELLHDWFPVTNSYTFGYHFVYDSHVWTSFSKFSHNSNKHWFVGLYFILLKNVIIVAQTRTRLIVSTHCVCQRWFHKQRPKLKTNIHRFETACEYLTWVKRWPPVSALIEVLERIKCLFRRLERSTLPSISSQ